MTAETIAGTDSTGLRARDVAMALAVVLPLAAIIAPYRHVHLPQLFILAIALMGGIWCFKTAVEDVEKLLFVFLLYIPFQKVLPGDFGGRIPAFNFTNALLLLLLAGWLSQITKVERPEGARRAPQGIAATIFLAITCVSMFTVALRETGEVRYAVLADLKRWLTPFAVYFLVVSIVRSTKAVKRMFLAVVVTTAVIGLLGVKQFWMDMGGGSRHNLEGIRIAVTSGPSNLGALFAYYLPYLLALWLSNIYMLSYWLLVAPIVWCLDSLRTTFSRGALVAFLAATLTVLFRKSKMAFLVVAVLTAAALKSSDMRLPYSIFGRMTSTYQANRPGETITDKLDKSSRTRLIIWSGAVDMVKEHPLFGVGYGAFPEHIGEYRPSVAQMDPHNNFLKIATEMGIPALVSFAALLVVCLWRGWRLYAKVEDPLLKVILLGYCGSVVGVIVANLFGSRLDSAEITTQFWAMTGGVVVIERAHAASESHMPAEERYEGA